jgi:hypothetical protein
MADNQDPLAALQKLLSSQQPVDAASQAASTTASSVANSALTDSEPEDSQEPANAGPTAQEIALLQEQKTAEDRLKIQAQLQMMAAELKATPQYQARLNQKESAEAELAKKRLEERSKKIFQLKHLENN